MSSEKSPSERFAAAKQKAKTAEVDSFASTLKFPLDDFQEHACRAIAKGSGVLVAAPTGAGKTIVGEFAIYLATQRGQKVFYTTPIKALSNQKYQELVSRYGENMVGILTGDNNTNSSAPIVVMTTEVLRNMIYANSLNLMNLGYVIMDEVHYLADRFRGAVWEEVILHLPKDVKLVSLSATVSNAEEFGAWLDEVRGSTEIIVSEKRPVPLNQHVLFGNELIDLFQNANGDFRVNQELANKHAAKLRAPAIKSNRPGRQRGNYQNEPKIPKVSKPELIQILEDADLLPAIFFIFSRVACDAAVKACQHSNLRLTTQEERKEIRQIVEDRCQSIADEDLQTLGYFEWLSNLERGVAAHHAGMLPAFKEIVEELFLKRLVRVVFATETLALGINMPARTVVLDRLDKFNGEGRVQITPGEYTQLTGRAGRRGIDNQGHSVIQWAGNLNPEMVAGLASKRTYPLVSSFRPTFNMAVNLISAFSRTRAREVLETSFAQFQADRSVVHLARTIRDREISLSGYANSMECHLGDFTSYSKIRRELSDLEREHASRRPKGGRSRDLRENQGKAVLEQKLARLKHDMKAHPCHRCPEREQHARWGERWWKLRRETDAIVEQIESRTNQVAKNFDRICQVLIEFEYLTEDRSGELEITSAGQKLALLYGERDLLVAEAIRNNIWNDLDAPGLSAMVAALVYEARHSEEYVSPRLPRGNFEETFLATQELWKSLEKATKRNKLRATEPIDPTIAYAIHRWVSGAKLDNVLFEADLLVGDFIRVCKQIVDLLEQISRAADGNVAVIANQAIDKMKRGIVAYSYYI
jgi:ATP-dependent RNA helicase HelY